MADEQDKPRSPDESPDVSQDAQPQDAAPEQSATPSPDEAIDAAKHAVDNVADADDNAGPTSLADDILAAARAAVADAASVASSPQPSKQNPPQAFPPSPFDDPEVQAAAAAPSERLNPLPLPDFDDVAGATDPKGIDLLSDVNLNVSIELGRTRMLVEDVLRLAEGAVVELDKLAGDPVDVYVNERLVARGEVLVLNDTFCIRVNEIVKQGAEAVAEAR
jgi:flagellar motor switch protein FliN/FliY